MKAVFKLEGLDNYIKLEQQIKKLPNVAENVINDYMHNTAMPKAISSIKEELPVSNRKHSKGLPKTKAKYGDSIKGTGNNLGFMVMSTRKYQYLTFPALGVGTSRKDKPNDFMNRGLNKIVSKTIMDLEEKLSKKMEEIL
ncbi:MAG: hypothetical protein PHG03_00245 [Bacilli bacterium]|nr:hypothetical protein [Bacilli bacterium]